MTFRYIHTISSLKLDLLEKTLLNENLSNRP